MNSVKPTRWHSSKQEKHVAKTIGGKQTPNSGATKFIKGDVRGDNILYECKTKTRPSTTLTMHKEWFTKNKEEAFAMGKEYSVVVFSFGDGENYYAIDEKLYKRFLDFMQEADK